MGTDKKAILSFSKPFVFAYTTADQGFEKDNISHPNYDFVEEEDKKGKSKRCVRSGLMEIPWGIGVDETKGYKAHGVMYVKRGRFDCKIFDGKGFEFERVGNIYYLYENELIDGTFRGFSVYIRALIMPLIRKIADSSANEREFRDRVTSITNDNELREMLSSHGLEPERVTCRTFSGEPKHMD